MKITKGHLESAHSRMTTSVDTQMKALVALLDDVPPPGNGEDGELALREAAIASNADRRIAKWDVTADLQDLRVYWNRIVFPYDQSPPWPVFDPDAERPVVGNLWFMANLQGMDGWYAGTVDWIRPHQKDKRLDVPEKHIDTAHALPTFIKEGPLGSYVPGIGDPCGFLVSSIARNGLNTVNERSNVLLFDWPSM